MSSIGKDGTPSGCTAIEEIPEASVPTSCTQPIDQEEGYHPQSPGVMKPALDIDLDSYK